MKFLKNKTNLIKYFFHMFHVNVVQDNNGKSTWTKLKGCLHSAYSGLIFFNSSHLTKVKFNICDVIKQNESEVDKYDFWVFFGIFY